MDTPVQADPKRGSWRWPVAVVAILCVSLVTCTITVIAATSDPGYAIEDDYYQRAVDWDQSRQAQAESDALGWSAEPTIDSSASRLRLTVRDAQGQPVEGAWVRATVFHHARRGLAEDLKLEAEGNGVYSAPLARPRQGEWQVRLRVVSGRDTFVQTSDIIATTEDGR
ncbi:MAG: FixH family protein [Phycisphaera sp.]|nr:MAG: FixH family protein [Phycisphaera sp.]